MDIYSPPGTKVIFDCYEGTASDMQVAYCYLTVNHTYTVKDIEVDIFTSRVELEEFPGVWFNTCLFSEEMVDV
jgi:hypothetical protein